MDINQTIKNSDSFISLLFEKKVEQICYNLEWSTTHSAYYTDPITNKPREIDISARRLWKHPKDNISIDVLVMIECKSNKGFHGLFTNNLRGTTAATVKAFWIGYENYTRYKTLQPMLSKEGLSESEIKTIIDQLEKKTFPQDTSLIAKYIPRINYIENFNAFRETNTKVTKDLETSVIWKSFQSLNSCVDGFVKLRWNHIEEWLVGQVDYANAKKISAVKPVLQTLDDYVSSVSIIHPVLVIDSPLFKVTGKEIVPLATARLIKLNVYGHCEDWVDIVHSENIEEYLQDLTEHYTSFFEGKQMINERL